MPPKDGEEKVKGTATKLNLNPAPEILKAHRFEGFRDKLYGKADDPNAQKFRQMLLTNEDGQSFAVTITPEQEPYLPKQLQVGDIIMVRTRQTIEGVTSHQSKDGTEVVYDKATGEFPTAMVDDRANESQAKLFNVEFQATIDAKAQAKAQLLMSQQTGEVMRNKIAGYNSLTDDERAVIDAKASVLAAF